MQAVPYPNGLDKMLESVAAGVAARGGPSTSTAEAFVSEKAAALCQQWPSMAGEFKQWDWVGGLMLIIDDCAATPSSFVNTLVEACMDEAGLQQLGIFFAKQPGRKTVQTATALLGVGRPIDLYRYAVEPQAEPSPSPQPQPQPLQLTPLPPNTHAACAHAKHSFSDPAGVGP